MKLFRLFFALTFCIFGHDFGGADENKKSAYIEFILDASNSMNDEAGGEVKLVTAKRVLTNLMNQIAAERPENLNIGLRVYGDHFDPYGTKEKACMDSTLEVPINGISLAVLTSQVQSVKATGYTPIAYSLGQTRNDFTISPDHRNVVILVSDGKESCGGDPCRVAAELKKSGVDVTIHVVGFAVDEETKKLLSCISDATGGIFVSADNALDLNKALQETMKVSVAPFEMPIVEASKIGTLTFSIIGLDRIDPNMEGRLLTEDGHIAGTLRIGETKEFSEGIYHLEVETSVEKLTRDVVIKVGEDTVVALRTKVGVLELGLFEDGVDVSRKSTVIVYKAGLEEEVRTVAPAKDKIFSLPEGKYDILANFPEAKVKPDKWLKGVELTAGAKIHKDIDFSLGVLFIKATLNQKPVNEFHIYIYKEGAAASKEAKLDKYYVVHDNWTSEVRKPLPEGKYDIWIQHQKSANLAPQWLSGLEVKLGEITETTADFGMGDLRIKSTVNGAEEDQFHTYVYKVGASKVRENEVKDFYVANENWKSYAQFVLNPGIYDVWVGHQKSPNVPAQWIEGVEVKVGEVTEKTVNFGMGNLRIKSMMNGVEVDHFHTYIYKVGASKVRSDEVKNFYVANENWKSYAQFALNPGTYDVWVGYQKSQNVPAQWIEGAQVKLGEQVEETLNFVSGTLKVRAVAKDSQKRNFGFQIFRQGGSGADKDELGKYKIDYGYDASEYKVILAPGVYDVYVNVQNSDEYPAQWIKDVEVKVQEVTERSVEFTKAQ